MSDTPTPQKPAPRTQPPASADASTPSRAETVLQEGIMSFGDHLEELRSCSIRALVGLLVAIAISLIFARRILAFLLQPVMVVLDAHGQRPEIQALSPPDTFMMYLKMGVMSGIILSMPWLLIQIWRFVSVGLYARERRFARLVVPASLCLFATGVIFLYYVVLPIVLNFFVTFGEQIEVASLQPNFMQRWIIGREDVEQEEVLDIGPFTEKIPLTLADPAKPPSGTAWFNTTRHELCVQTENGRYTVVMEPKVRTAGVKSQFGLSFYVSFVLMLSLAFGLAFELPLVVLFLTGLGIVSVDEMTRARRYVILGIVTLAAILTPPDVISQLLLAFPMLILFEGALLVSRAMEKRRTTA